MFDLNAKDGSVRIERYKSPIPAGNEAARARPPIATALDGDKMRDLHKKNGSCLADWIFYEVL